MSTFSNGLVAHHVTVRTPTGDAIVHDVSLNAQTGRTLVIVGESGAGKSMLARTLCALTPSALHASGQVSIDAESIDIEAQAGTLKKKRGHGIVWLPQDPFTSLVPTMKCAWQITAARTGTRTQRNERAQELLRAVGLARASGQRLPA